MDKDLQFILFVLSVFKVISNGGSVYLRLDTVLSSHLQVQNFVTSRPLSSG